MPDEDLSPLPFRRERNLSNRNFNKRNSRQRLSISSCSSQPDNMCSATTARTAITNTLTDTDSEDSYALASENSSSFQLSYSVNSDTENAFNRRSLLKMRPAVTPTAEQCNARRSPMPDPAMLDVQQKVQHFETLKTNITYIKAERDSLKNLPQIVNSHCKMGQQPKEDKVPTLKRKPRGLISELRQLPIFLKSTERRASTSSVQQTSIDEVRSEDEVDNISDFEADANAETDFILPETAEEIKEGIIPKPMAGYNDFAAADVNGTVIELGIDDFGKIEIVKRSISADQANNSSNNSSGSEEAKPRNAKDFRRNFRSKPRRKTEIIGITNELPIDKFHSLYKPKSNEEDEYEQIEYREKSDKCVYPILEELVHTEQAYVENLRKGIQNYGNIFQRKDLPVGLRGKKYDLFGNIEQIYEFHRDEFLPMLQRNQHDLKCLFEQFLHFIEDNCLYCYVVFTMNKQKSLKLCDVYKNYFKLIQSELDDKLGINSFLVQPIQRMARYPLLLTQFINTFFKNRDIVMKPLIESCCRLEKRLRSFLITTNESEIINDIVDCNEFNVFYQGKFRKVSEFQVTDHTLKRSYRSKVFIFDKCIIYTEIKGKHLIFHGRYPCEHIGIVAKAKSFTLFYERRKQQECDFFAETPLINTWLNLIKEMINSFANEERLKLRERYLRDSEHAHRKPPTLSLYRDSNRFSSDSGIGNIWVMPKPDEEQANNRTTWYAAPN